MILSENEMHPHHPNQMGLFSSVELDHPASK
jgi:hypothetical protein